MSYDDQGGVGLTHPARESCRFAPGKGYVYCIISPVARISGIYYHHPRKWWKTRKEAEDQAKRIIRDDPRAVLVVVKATHKLEADPMIRSVNIK